MSLLEEALRRHGAMTRGQAGTPASRPSRDRPAAAAPHKTDVPPAEETAAPPAPAPARARLMAVVMPLMMLLLFIAVAWIMLRMSRMEGKEPRHAPAAAAAAQPEAAPALQPEASLVSPPGAPAAPRPETAQALPPETPSAPRVVVVTNLVVAPPPEASVAGAGAVASAPPAAEEAAGAAVASDTPGEIPPWPMVAVKGIAFGREQLVVLDTGEMLAAGERSRTGVRVARIEPDGAWIEWHGVTNMLRKGEDTTKPLQE